MKWTIVGATVLGLTSVASHIGVAQGQSAQETVERLNEEAMEAYHLMDIERSAELLQRALQIGEERRVTAAAMAVTHRNLAVVYIGAYGDLAAGEEQFVQGLCAAKNLELDPLTSTPQMQKTFEAAHQRAEAGACNGQWGDDATDNASMTEGPLPDPEAQMRSTAAPAQSYEQLADEETPWGTTVKEDDGEMAPFFFQLAYAAGLSWVTHGMTADRPPPLNRVFLEPDETGREVFVEDPIGRYLQNQFDMMNTTTPLPGQEAAVVQPVAFRLPDSRDGPLLGDWVPDADSEDSYTPQAGPYGGSCHADGIPTGPQLVDPQTGEGLVPSKYCVRVKQPGFVYGNALRGALGYFVSDRVSLAAVGRFQFTAGQGNLASILVGARGEILITSPKESGFFLSLFAGSTFGQIQAKISEAQDGPWTVAGLFAAHGGVALRYRFHRNVGVLLAPEFDMFFPDRLLHVDIPMGLELAF